METFHQKGRHDAPAEDAYAWWRAFLFQTSENYQRVDELKAGSSSAPGC